MNLQQRVKPKISKSCVFCSKVFKTNRTTKVYCSKLCNDRSYNSKFRTPSIGDILCIPDPTVGALGEILVSADLLQKGFGVFRSISPACPHDLVITKDGLAATVEVRTGSRNYRDRKIRWGNTNIRSQILAVVVHGEGIFYQVLDLSCWIATSGLFVISGPATQSEAPPPSPTTPESAVGATNGN